MALLPGAAIATNDDAALALPISPHRARLRDWRSGLLRRLTAHCADNWLNVMQNRCNCQSGIED